MLKAILLVVGLAVNFAIANENPKLTFKGRYIFDDLMPVSPSADLRVDFWSGVRAKYGNYLSVNDVDEDPVTEWLNPNDDSNTYFTLIAIDADKKHGKGTGYLLWLVNNISANSPDGDIIVKYQGPSGHLHRIAFFVYIQEGPIDVLKKSVSRKGFNLAAYAVKHTLAILAGNYLYTSEE